MNNIKQINILFSGLIVVICTTSAGMFFQAIGRDHKKDKYTTSYFEIRDILIWKIQKYNDFEDSVSAQLVQINLLYNHFFYLETYAKDRQMAKEGERMKTLLGSWQNTNTVTWPMDSASIVTGLKKHDVNMLRVQNDLIRLEKRLLVN